MTKKHQLFIDNYFLHKMNGLQAYLASYPGVSIETAKVNASKLLTKTNIKEEIAKRQELISKEYEVKKEDLIKDLIDIKNTNKDTDSYAAMKAIEILNKMLGHNASEKQEVTIKQEQPLFLPLNKNNG